MAKQKQSNSESELDHKPAFAPREERYGPLDYIIVNVVFIAFCFLQFAVIKFITGEQIGLFFFFSAIITGFVLVSVFMYVYDTVAEESEDQEPLPPDVS